MNYDPMGDFSSTVESSVAHESKDSQPDPTSATTSSFSTASPLLPVPLGTMNPNMWPLDVPESVKKIFAAWEAQTFIEFKDQLKAVYRKKFTIATMKDHLLYKTRPADLGHKFTPFQNLPHSIHEVDRERHKANELSLFNHGMQLILESRVFLLEEDLSTAKKILKDMQDRTLLRDKLLSSSPSLNPFMLCFDAHFTAFRSRVELALAAKRDEYSRHVTELSAASVAAVARQSTAALHSVSTVDSDVTMTEDAAANPSMSSSSTAAAPPGNASRAAAPAPAIIPPRKTTQDTVTPVPVPASVTADTAALATLQAQMAQLTAALAKLTTGAQGAPAPNRARTAASNQKGPKNLSGPGGKSTTQTPSRDGRASRPMQRPEDHRQHRHESRSRDRRSYRSPSRPPSRSDSSRYKRQPSPSRDREDDRWHSSSRPRTSRRSPSPPPRQHHRDRRDDRDSDRGRLPRRESSRRDK